MANKKTNFYFVRMIMFNGDKPTLCKRNHAYCFCTTNDIKQFKDMETASTIALKKAEFANVEKVQIFFKGKQNEDAVLKSETINPNYDYFKMLADMKSKALRRKYNID